MEDHDIILFDGVCNLCSGAVKFIVKRDRRAQFRFASLQSSFAQKQLEQMGVNVDRANTMILIHGQYIFQRSDAVLEIARRLDGLWPVFYAARIIPRFIRDAMYKLVASNRYRLFGKKESCMVPTQELRARFIA
jgi:predicted DCC family thiol-disulfide oxidoreductase YuxK